jgi:hypothetical protein
LGMMSKLVSWHLANLPLLPSALPLYRHMLLMSRRLDLFLSLLLHQGGM